MKQAEHKLLGESNAYLTVLEQVSRLTALNRPVLVVGERGTGKELIAERLHFLSDRWAKPLVKMNCAAVSDSLLESELFGHEAGAFTGATKRHIGRFERADGGTLFLDELATMSLKLQEKLLRFIEYGEFERLGGSTSQRIDVRLVAATNEDLPDLAEQGRFRHDLLDRLAFDVITLPPLRERQEDILLLAEFFAVSMCKELSLAYFPGFSTAAKTSLLGYHWPGNIRELKNVIERSVYRQQDKEQPLEQILLDPFESPFRPQTSPVRIACTGAAIPPPLSGHRLSKPVNTMLSDEQLHADRNGAVKLSAVKLSAAKLSAAKLPAVKFPLDFKEACRQQEIRWLKAAMEQAKFNQREAAKLLQLTYHQLRTQLRKYHLL